MKRRVTAGRVFAGVLLFIAAEAVFVELFRFWRDGAYQTLPVAEIWLNINANSLVGFGAIIEQKISPWLWFEVLVPFLSLPAWLVFGAPGALLAWYLRRRRRPMFRRH